MVRAAAQPVWRDETSGFARRSVSPPHAGLRGEVVEGTLRPGADIAYNGPPVPGVEQHIWVLEGAVGITANGQAYEWGRGTVCGSGCGEARDSAAWAPIRCATR
ncbi:hypothetical protein SANTM175S_07660 [Streptomyces antimycoticus]